MCDIRKSFLLILLPSLILAQPTLNFKRIEVRYPEIKLAFAVTCAGQIRYDFGPQHYEVRENGFLVKDVTLWCPLSDSCCVSASLVFDRSGSMADPASYPKIERLKNGANAYFDMMNLDGRACDEASVVSFNDRVTIDAGMTSDKNVLRSVVNSYNASGRTAVWDATAIGIQLMQSAKNRCKGLILVSDGGDNSSQWHSVESLIQLAIANEVKIFTIGLGMQAGSIEDIDMKTLADMTGGKYYRSQNGSDLVTIYKNIREVIKQEYRECYITYRSTCPDGSRRIVDLTIKNFCNGSDTKTRSYIAPLDRLQFKDVILRVGTDTVVGLQQKIIPVFLDTPVNGIFSKSNITILFDRSVCRLLNVTTNGTILQGVPVTFQNIPGGCQIVIPQHTMIDGSGPLFYLLFETDDVPTLRRITLQLYEWKFDAYCLKPVLLSGELHIKPRAPILRCALTMPRSIVWNDATKDYEPNPFAMIATINNLGTDDARSLRAQIRIESTALTLVSPKFFIQNVTPSTLQPMKQAVVQWDLGALKTKKTDSGLVCITITSSNHPPIMCCEKFTIGKSQAPKITCDVKTLDTIFFREQYYEPEFFDVDVTAVNTGDGRTRDVVAQMLQDSRFTIVPPAMKIIADTLLAGDTSHASFRLQIHPRQTDGYDTVRIHVQGADTDPAWCQYPIWVQRERTPKFKLVCTVEPDSLNYDERVGDYSPNPFVLHTTATNIGETYAEECQIMFVGPPRFAPLGTNLRPVGTMMVGDVRRESWQLGALPRNVDGWDTLVFQISGKGGLGKRIIIAECRVPVFVPATRKPLYFASCSIPDTLRADGSKYKNDPFRITIAIVNRGTGSGFDLPVTISLPQGVALATGENPTQVIPRIDPNRMVLLSWFLTASPRSIGDLVKICIAGSDRLGIQVQCCGLMYITKIDPPELKILCSSIDTLKLDSESGEYIGNPFAFEASLVNQGRGRAEAVRVILSMKGEEASIIGSIDTLIGNIDAGKQIELRWFTLVQKKSSSRFLSFDVKVLSSKHAEITCTKNVFVEPYLKPLLHAECSSHPEDTLHFDWAVGNFSPQEITLSLEIRNTGQIRARNVTAFLLLPPNISLAQNEVALKSVAPNNLQAGEDGRATWKVLASRADEGKNCEFRFLIRSDNAEEIQCIDPLFVQGAPRHVTLSIPDNILLSYGARAYIPIHIDRTIGKDMYAYSFEYRYDPKLMTILHATNAGSLTETNWVGVQLAQLEAGRIRLSDFTTGKPLASEAGILLQLFAQGEYKGSELGIGEATLSIDSSTAKVNDGEVTVHTIDGYMYATPVCLQPLAGDEKYFLKQNHPNPFGEASFTGNSITQISFSIPHAAYAKLVVFDRLGRIVQTLLEGVVGKGSHLVQFNAGDLPSDIYYYRLETANYSSIKKMLLVR